LSWDLHKLFQSHAAEVVRTLRRRGHPADVAADIAQDAFVRLLTADPALGRAAGNPRAYLHRISRNLSIDYRRRERVMGHVDVSDDELLRIADPAPSQETICYDKQRLAATQRAIEELPERTRKAFELHRLDEYTISEVAEEVGLSTTRTWVLIRDAYRHIRARLSDI
jgi:RNA polymerase sigma factor (sigma-70 family)